MSKKSLGLGSLIGEEPVRKKGRPITQTKEITSSSQEGTKENETRATLLINIELLDKLKALAYWDRVLIKDVVNTAIQEYVDKRNPKPRPEEARLKDQEANQRLIRTHGNKARLPKF